MALALAAVPAAYAQQNVLQPGDPVIASSSNSPGSEGVANAIDGKPTKYLNFDTRNGAAGKPSGFVVTPSVGVTRVTGIALESANDGKERDAKTVLIEGSNDETITGWDSNTWTPITTVENIPSWDSVFGPTDAENRFKFQSFSFTNLKPYKSYRITVLETQTANGCCFQVAEVQLLGNVLPKNVVQPGDPILASSSNSPGSEGVANAIDGKPTKYLNFDTRNGAAGKPSGFVVTPSLGKTVISGVTLESANDGKERDAKHITIEGSNDDSVTAFDGGNWSLITEISDIPSWESVFGPTDAENRFKTQTLLFDNFKPYKSYRFTVLETQTANGCCFQIAEVGFLGTGEPKNVAQPGDPIIASSSNSPGSEGVANAIDGKPTKYLNFDTRNGAAGKPSGFVVTPSVGATTITGISLESANDGKERDAKHITIEGSNDDSVTAFDSGNWTLITEINDIPSWESVFGPTDAENRFKTQSLYFPNQKAYKSYRFTVLETQTANGCCFQVAEVGFLAVTSQADCSKARFVLQPTDVQVLDGSKATFISDVNGPWPLQWLKNNVAIPGATAKTYTTEAVTASNASDTYAVQIVGCEVSREVKAVIFTPSATKSIGISFAGGGANGAPTSMNTNDIAGLQPQAFWNNLTAKSGDAGSADGVLGTGPTDGALTDSDNNGSTITFSWSSSDNWGAGTGDGTPTQRMLNGLIHVNPGTIGTLTFNNVPAGTHSVIVYAVGIPLQFQNANYSVLGEASQTYYTRVINADEFNAAPGFFRATGTTPEGRTLANYIRFDNVKPAADGSIQVSWETLTPGFDRGAPVNGLQLILAAPAVGNPPQITSNPQPSVGPVNGSVQLSVAASGSGLTYQWRKGGKNLVDGGNISGGTTDKLTISDLSAEDEGIYSVAVFNAAGSVISRNASVRVSKYDIKDALAGYWKFDESEGATAAANSLAGGNPVKIEGAATWQAGKVGGSLNFDGGSTYGGVTNYAKANRQLSFSGWVNVDPSVGGPVQFVRNAESTLGIAPADQFEIGLTADTDGVLHLSAAITAGPNTARVTDPAAFVQGEWRHIAFTADAAQVRLYSNGSEVGSAADYINAINPAAWPFLTFGARLTQNTADPENIFIAPDATTPELLVGNLDEVALWNRGLSAEEVTKLFAAGNSGKLVTDVVVAPPANQPGHPTISLSAGKVNIAWDLGKLQTAPTVKGPWTTDLRTSPISETPAGQKFYRTITE